MATQVYLLPLDDLGAPRVRGTYILLPPPNQPYVLRLSIEGSSSVCREGSLWVNIPKKGSDFDRNTYHEYTLTPDFTKTINVDIPIDRAGSFSFYTTYTPLPDFKEQETKPEPTKTPLYYVCVPPSLTIDDKIQLPLNALSIFSVISKWLGPLSSWDGHMARIGDKGYNMVHFTPMMHRGESNSPYSIYDQMTFDPEMFPKGEKDVNNVVMKMEKEYGLLSLTDVVWNHTANNSQWLQDHPESGYNMVTAPWLESAYELDTALLSFSKRLGTLGFATDLKSTGDLLKIMEGIKTHAIGAIRLWEYYVVNVDKDAEAGLEAWKAGKGKKLDLDSNWSIGKKAEFLSQIGLKGADRMGERFRRYIDPEVLAGFALSFAGVPSKDEDELDAQETRIRTELVKHLDEVNLPFYKEYDEETAEIMEQLYNRIKYVRLDDHGPKQGPISSEYPLIESYFTRLPQNKRTSKHKKEELAVANNGWIWNANPLVDFAGSTSRAYLRREVIVWGDCVKLRYGKTPEDSPFLWKFMREYTELMAKVFQGFRIDNCHSTPLHVAEYLLDAARRVRPNLYVVAELFSGSEEMDYVFVKRLGLNSLIREAMQAWGPGELSRLIHRHGGKPIGSFDQDDLNHTQNEIIRTVTSSPVHALFMDCTHDNETPTQKRVPEDTLPNGALVAMCACATGSVMGYDEIYPKLLDLVNEKRLYSTDQESLKKNGIGHIKKIFNKIHVEMGIENFVETHIHHEGEYITVHRVHPKTQKGYFLIAHTAFSSGTHRGDFNPVYLNGPKAKAILTARLSAEASNEQKEKVLSMDVLTGLASQVLDLSPPRIEERDGQTIITIPEEFPPGSIALIETWIPGLEGEQLDKFVTSGADEAVKETTLADLNFVLYRCDVEERDHSDGQIGVYDIPDHGALVYAGLQGWWSVLQDVIRNNDMGHALCQHLRNGTWALDYIVTRLEKLRDRGYKNLAGIATWLKERSDKIKDLPNFLIPRYFGLLIQTAYAATWKHGISLMSEHVQEGHKFVQSLAMVSVQMTGFMNSASLTPFKSVPCLAAGLPHFASEYMRCWGRDVFIALRGLLLGTGRFEDAKAHILAFATVLKHGMIPNLLDGGNKPRYNSRDSIWFFLQSIQDYVKLAPNGTSLLKEKVKRRFLPNDDTWFPKEDKRAFSKESTIEEIIYESLSRHAAGMSFREANAGHEIDSQMKSEGFQIDIKVDWNTGLIFGGNQSNCGTWMDKMGESEKAGNKGVPGTPRDGAAIEITGMLYSTLRWVDSLNKKGQFQWRAVELPDGPKVAFADWADKIKSSFEHCYYVPVDKGDDSEYDVNPKMVNRRGIYKDLYKSGKEYEDYQLRPNFAITMTVAPELFETAHALAAIHIADEAIRGETGMATLDPKDLNYRPNYHNSEDSHDFATSKGRNYHQGPEWLWPTGFFLRAFLHFDLKGKKTLEEKAQTFQQIHRRLAGCKKAIEESAWAGLTELTNEKNSYCADSCPTQAWSAGCLIDLYQDAREVYAES